MPDRLRFPAFQRDVLLQQHWNAGDDMGRVKLVIAEGFTRDGYPCKHFQYFKTDERLLTSIVERVKNIVSFSFQHAPLAILEESSVAWPNPAMWRQIPPYDPYTEPVHAAFNAPRVASAGSSNVSMRDVESRKSSYGSKIL